MVKGDNPDKKRYSGPPGLGVGREEEEEEDDDEEEEEEKKRIQIVPTLFSL